MIIRMNFSIWHLLNAKRVLENKALFEEIKSILSSIEPHKATHNYIRDRFKDKGWIPEKYIFENTRWAWDAYKDKVAISIEFSLIDAIQRDLLRGILAYNKGSLEVLVFLLDLVISEPHFENVKKQIEIFSSILKYPILLVGIDIIQ